MTRTITTAVLLLLLAGGAFLLTQYDRTGWAQQVPASTGTADQRPASVEATAPAVSAKAPRSAYPSTRVVRPTYAVQGQPAAAATTFAAPAPQPTVPAAGSPMSDMAGGMEGMMGGAPMGMGGDAASAQEDFGTQLNRQVAALRQAESEDGKEAAKQAIAKLLGDYFDRDMELRQQELDKVKERVAKLEALLSKRQAAKQEILDLQLKTMVNESEGLGFFSRSGPEAPSFGGGGYGGYGMEYGDPGMGLSYPQHSVTYGVRDEYSMPGSTSGPEKKPSAYK